MLGVPPPRPAERDRGRLCRLGLAKGGSKAVPSRLFQEKRGRSLGMTILELGRLWAARPFCRTCKVSAASLRSGGGPTPASFPFWEDGTGLVDYQGVITKVPK